MKKLNFDLLIDNFEENLSYHISELADEEEYDSVKFFENFPDITDIGFEDQTNSILVVTMSRDLTDDDANTIVAYMFEDDYEDITYSYFGKEIKVDVVSIPNRFYESLNKVNKSHFSDALLEDFFVDDTDDNMSQLEQQENKITEGRISSEIVPAENIKIEYSPDDKLRVRTKLDYLDKHSTDQFELDCRKQAVRKAKESAEMIMDTMDAQEEANGYIDTEQLAELVKNEKNAHKQIFFLGNSNRVGYETAKLNAGQAAELYKAILDFMLKPLTDKANSEYNLEQKKLFKKEKNAATKAKGMLDVPSEEIEEIKNWLTDHVTDIQFTFPQGEESNLLPDMASEKDSAKARRSIEYWDNALERFESNHPNAVIGKDYKILEKTYADDPNYELAAPSCIVNLDTKLGNAPQSVINLVARAKTRSGSKDTKSIDSCLDDRTISSIWLGDTIIDKLFNGDFNFHNKQKSKRY